MAKFKKISTAPKDGTKIITKRKGADETIAWFNGKEWLCKDLINMRRQYTLDCKNNRVPLWVRRFGGGSYEYNPDLWKPIKEQNT